MRVGDWETHEEGETRVVSANVGGFRLWFRSPRSYRPSRAGNPFLASALLPAMAEGRGLEVDQDLPVSPKLLGFSRSFVPATDHYSYLMPLGTHPLTDPLYSNEAVEIVHDGAETQRIDKVLRIAECRPALENLRVCTEDMNVNCGKCAKCLRTQISLRLLGISGAPFPPLELKAIKRMNWRSEPRFFKENTDLAIRKGDKELRDLLLAVTRRSGRTHLLKEIDRVLFGGLVKRAYRGIARATPKVRRISATPPSD